MDTREIIQAAEEAQKIERQRAIDKLWRHLFVETGLNGEGVRIHSYLEPQSIRVGMDGEIRGVLNIPGLAEIDVMLKETPESVRLFASVKRYALHVDWIDRFKRAEIASYDVPAISLPDAILKAAKYADSMKQAERQLDQWENSRKSLLDRLKGWLKR